MTLVSNHVVLRAHAVLIRFLYQVADIVAIIVAALIAGHWRFDHWGLPQPAYLYEVLIFIALLLSIVLFNMAGLYRSWRGRTVIRQLVFVVFAWLAVLLILVLLGFLAKLSDVFSRQCFAYWAFSGMLLLIGFRMLAIGCLRLLQRCGFGQRRIVVIGSGPHAKHILKTLFSALWTGLQVNAVFSLTMQSPRKTVGQQHFTIAKLPESLLDYVQEHNIQEIWLAVSLKEQSQIVDILNELRHTTVVIRLLPDLLDLELLNHSISVIAGLQTINLRESPMLGANRVIKRIEDIVLGLFGLMLASPVMLIVAVCIKCSSKGPILFAQLRYGIDGRSIKVYKFRSMYVHAEQGKVTQASKGDTRITPVGRFLRKSSLDELPQFWNVLQGRMSLVGPRPHAVEHNEYYKDLVSKYMLRHAVKPGITGWAQVNGYRGETETLDKMAKRVEYDLTYIESWSLWLDLKILFLTVFRGFFNKNAY